MSPSLTGQILIEDKLTFGPTIYQSHVFQSRVYNEKPVFIPVHFSVNS